MFFKSKLLSAVKILQVQGGKHSRFRGGESFTVLTDDQGCFEVGGRPPGLWPQPIARSGLTCLPSRVRTKEQARRIELGGRNGGTDISLKLLPSSQPR